MTNKNSHYIITYSYYNNKTIDDNELRTDHIFPQKQQHNDDE